MPGGGGAWRAVIWNIWPTKPSGVQLPMAIRPPGRQTRSSSDGHNLGPRRKHGAEHGHHHVEAGSVVGQLLGIALDEFDFQIFIGGAFAGLLQKIGREVEADDVRPVAGGGNGLISRAAGHVQDFRPWLEIDALDEAFSLADIQFCNFTEVARHPTGPQALLQLPETIWPSWP